MKNLKVALAAACAVVFGWAFTASADISSAYVETTGSQYLITDFYADPTTKVEADMTITTVTATTRQQRFFGADSDQTSWPFSFSVYQNGEDKFGCAAKDGAGNWGNSGYLLSNVKGKRILLTLDAWNGGAASYLLSVVDRADGNVLKSWTTTTTRTQTSSRPLGIACNNRTDAPLHLAYMKIYSVKIWKKNQLVCCYVPYWNEDKSVIGLKDLFTGNVVENSGSGTLECGGELASDPSAYLPEGYRWNSTAGRVEVRVSVALKGAGGTVSVAGGGSEVWVEPGTTVPFTITTSEGQSVVMWRGGTPIETGAGAYSVKAGGSVSLTASVGKRLCTWTGEAGDGLWATGGNWDTGSAPAEGDVVLVEGAAITLDEQTPRLAMFELSGSGAVLTMKEKVRARPEDLVTALRADRVDIRNGAKVTHGPNSMQTSEYLANVAGGWKMDARVNVECADFTLDAASTINVDNCGFRQTETGYGAPGPGGSTNRLNTIAGCYGGFGGGARYNSNNANVFLRSDVYGSAEAPIWCGSAGDYSKTDMTKWSGGGGAVRIEASGKVTIDGRISALPKGAAGSNDNLGSGGGIWISCRTFAGSGALVANGANYSSARSMSSGGGGRVALTYDPAAQDAADAAAGCVPQLSLSAGVGNPAWTSAGVGTVYMTDDRLLTETFSSTGPGVRGGEIVCGTWSRWHPQSLLINNVSIRLTGAQAALNLPGGLIVSGDQALLQVGGEDRFWQSRNINSWPYERRISKAMPSLTTSALTLENGGRLYFWPSATNETSTLTYLPITVSGALTVGTGGYLYVPCHCTNGAVAHVSCASADIAGTISSSSGGFVGLISGKSGYGASGWYCGHGGAGGRTTATGRGGYPYDDLEYPVYPGCSGGTGQNYGTQSAGSGGGVVWLDVAGELALTGTIAANGAAGGGNRSASGAGGTVRISCRTLTGTGGQITATAAAPETDGTGAAGGGRISIHYDRAAQAAVTPKPSVGFSVDSLQKGDSTVGHTYADMGTIWLPDAALLGDVFNASTLYGGEVHLGDWSGYEPKGLLVDKARVRLAIEGHPLTIAGDIVLTNAASLGFGGGAYMTSNSVCELCYTPGTGPRILVTGNVKLVGGAAPRYSTYKSDLVLLGGLRPDGLPEGCGGLLRVDGNVTVGDNGRITYVSQQVTGDSPKVEARNLRVDAAGELYANCRGFPGVNQCTMVGGGPGGGGNGDGTSSHSVAGGGYGGVGESGSYGLAHGLAYGDEKRPTACGSGGSGYNTGSYSGAGGGLIWFEADNRISFAGKATANGGGGAQNNGGGSGGGIYLKCVRWITEATATLSAKGGDCGWTYKLAGGAGRVAVWYQTDEDDVFRDDASVTDRGYSTRSYVNVDPGTIGGSDRPPQSGTVVWKRWAGFMLFVR